MRGRKLLVISVAVVGVAAFVGLPAAGASDTLRPVQGGGESLRQDRSGPIDKRNRHHNRGDRKHGDFRSPFNTVDAKGGKRYRGPAFSGDGPLADLIPELGTFVGGISAVRDRQNGIYFYRDGNKADSGNILTAPAPKGPKIISVTPESFDAACDTQGGVCVIKPR